LLVDRIERGWSVLEAAEAAGITARTARRWLARWRVEGAQGLLDRSSAPKRIPHKTPPERVAEIVRLRRLRMTAAQIATALQMALSTVSAVLKRVGLGKRSRLEPPEPPNRYERRRAGELIHIDIKKLGRILNRAIASPVIGAGRLGRIEVARLSAWPAGSSCTWRSTITAAWPTPRF
jgi:transposase